MDRPLARFSMDGVDAALALVPSVGVGILFYFIIRSMIRADRTEREALKQLEKQEAESPIDRRQDPPSPEGGSKTG